MECSFCFRRFLSFISFHVSSDSRFFPFYYFYNLWKYSNALLWCFQLLQTCFRQKYRYCASCIGLSPRHYHLLWVRNIESPTDCSYLFSNALIWLCDSFRDIPMKTCYSGLMLSVIISWIAHNSFWTLSNSRGSNSSTFTSTWSCTLTYLEWLMIVLQFRA